MTVHSDDTNAVIIVDINAVIIVTLFDKHEDDGELYGEGIRHCKNEYSLYSARYVNKTLDCCTVGIVFLE